jgi:hypothetical protein
MTGVGEVALAVAAAGAGAAAAGAFSGTPSVGQPGSPNPGETYAQVLQDQINLAPQQFAAEQQYAPQYANLYQGIQQGQMGGMMSMYQQYAPQLQALQSQLQGQQLQGNISNLQQYAPQAVSAFGNANPQIAQVQGAQVNQALNYSNPTIDALNQSAQQQLALGGSMSTQQASTVANQVLSNYNQMGRANDPTAIAGLATGLDTYSQQLLAQRQQAAASAGGLTLANSQMQQGLLGGAESSLMGTTMPALGMAINPSSAFQGTAGIYGQNQGQSTGAQNFNYMNAGTQLYGDYYGATQNANIANANISAGKQAGEMQLGGQLFGAGLGTYAMCWLAREVYGAENTKWQDFRDWMIKHAPENLRNGYLEHGPLLAWRVSQLPRLKARLREAMDNILEMEAVK